ncbi:sensor histidine kinase [Lutispora thermophila]|uniref:histidine kinase n=1 Tax=Lutispora thermophila DSM 19022 TaxID=1122184 RepID=A0A1M6ASU0_9FIRM|nr:ATP-binding protein [Lutispora thermophila]SHI39535.1 two-component system, sensor histidine kinase YcbA [Lutispora thermophila DSM 19022]
MKRLKSYLLPVICVTLFGEIYFYPFSSSFRFSAGIIVLNLIILILDDLSEFMMAFLSGISVFFIRSLIDIVLKKGTLQYIYLENFPSAIYYMLYGTLAVLLSIKKYKDKILVGILLLSIVDSLSNIIEALIRDRLLSFNMVQIIILVGLARSITAYIIYIMYKNQELFIQKREHQKRYSQLNLLVSDIQAEMFYLKKSMADIEKVMSKSYKLYEKYKEDKELQEDTLDIAREVHEIKKDYNRVLGGFESFLKKFETNDLMTIIDIKDIIEENTNRYLDSKGLINNIHIEFDFKDKFSLSKYYSLFTILNNLIVNALDACGSKGKVKVLEISDKDNIYFHVEDNGIGIEEEILPYIFNPGFTTKYYPDTGKASTGIGLSHVKNIVEELGGSIVVDSKPGQGTLFTVVLPKNSLLG